MPHILIGVKKYFGSAEELFPKVEINRIPLLFHHAFGFPIVVATTIVILALINAAIIKGKFKEFIPLFGSIKTKGFVFAFHKAIVDKMRCVFKLLRIKERESVIEIHITKEY